MPIRDIQLDSSGNRLLSGAGYAFADGQQAVKQGIECRVRLFLGEYWLDGGEGVDWINRILIRNPNALIVQSELSRAIAAISDSSTFISFSFANLFLIRVHSRSL